MKERNHQSVMIYATTVTAETPEEAINRARAEASRMGRVSFGDARASRVASGRWRVILEIESTGTHRY